MMGFSLRRGTGGILDGTWCFGAKASGLLFFNSLRLMTFGQDEHFWRIFFGSGWNEPGGKPNVACPDSDLLSVFSFSTAPTRFVTEQDRVLNVDAVGGISPGNLLLCMGIFGSGSTLSV